MILPDGRSVEYTIWRVCERLGIRPPGVSQNWDENLPWIQMLLLAYEGIRQHEDMKFEISKVEAMIGRP